jgi:hypothetical protein
VARDNSILSIVGGREALVLLGGSYGASAVGYPLVIDSPVGTDLLMVILVGGSGLILLGGGYWLTRSDIRSEVYSVVVTWCLRGIGVMLALLGLTALTAGLRNPVQNVLILTAIGSVAGFAAGIHDARAKTRELELECFYRRNDDKMICARGRKIGYGSHRTMDYHRLYGRRSVVLVPALSGHTTPGTVPVADCFSEAA